MKAHIVKLEEIQKYQYTLALNRYMPNTEPEDLFDLKALIHGGFPSADLDTIKEQYPLFEPLINQIFDKRVDQPYYDLKVASDTIHSINLDYINEHVPDTEREQAIKHCDRISTLVDRYGKSLIELEREHAVMKETVNNHLKRMGIL